MPVSTLHAAERHLIKTSDWRLQNAGYCVVGTEVCTSIDLTHKLEARDYRCLHYLQHDTAMHYSIMTVYILYIHMHTSMVCFLLQSTT